MGSKGRFLPPHLRRPLPGPGMMHPDPFGPPIHPSRGTYPPFDILPPAEVMEHKLDAQYLEMQRLATENQRLAATHITLRQEVALAQQELQRMQTQIGTMKNEKEQHMRGLLEKMSKMEVDLQASEPVKMELQQARNDAESLMVARHELITKVHQLSQDLQKIHSDSQQVPALMSELEGLRQEFQHCSLQLLVANLEGAPYGAPTGYTENETARQYPVAQNSYEGGYGAPQVMTNTANPERRGPPYGGPTGYKETEATAHHPVGQSAYEDGYGVSQGRGLPAAPASYAGVPPGPPPPPTAQAGYEAPPRAGGYDSAPRGAHPNYNNAYDAPQPPRGATSGLQGQMLTPQGNSSVPTYGSASATPPVRPGGGSGYEPQKPRGGLPIRI
ncbi:hypothetical protein GIB67_005321 [Kingdonia uniflora]|uniref:Uncharacterized protein n=1 Tax=Kingdonia uniflora TaxID=39325 RepID=A0A7J7PAP2_9MAGN|nr:hypothetical protein GIB67_005321 [Kingdonia uniflora]